MISWQIRHCGAQIKIKPNSWFLKFQADGDDDDEGNEDPIDMSFPKEGGWKKIVVYLISFPIMAPLFYTLPDTKNKESKFFRTARLASQQFFDPIWLINPARHPFFIAFTHIEMQLHWWRKVG